MTETETPPVTSFEEKRGAGVNVEGLVCSVSTVPAVIGFFVFQAFEVETSRDP